jgi:cytochrome bd-type quinol oxidase subunit 1
VIYTIHRLQLNHTPMSLLNFTRSALRRPFTLSAFVAVGVALILALHGHWTYSDLLKHQPVTTRKMHIQSIPMCKFGCLMC